MTTIVVPLPTSPTAAAAIADRLNEALRDAQVDTSRKGGRAPSGQTTVAELATETGLNESVISHMRKGRGEDRAASLVGWCRLAKRLNVRVEWLFLGELPKARNGDRLREIDRRVLERLAELENLMRRLAPEERSTVKPKRGTDDREDE